MVGEGNARDADLDDAVEGVRPRFFAAPGSVAEVSDLLRLASASGWKVAPAGAGTKRGWGSPPASLDLVLSTRRLDRLIEHSAGDLVVRAEAGMTLDRLQTLLAGAGQVLALDPAHTDATLGGVIATNASGPRRLRYGTVRDLLIGINVVLADGTVAKSGGKVVKNVAGYDLAKLFTGSLGTLGVIVDATFRLHPKPPTQRLVEAEAKSPDAVGAALTTILRSGLMPTALNLATRTDAPFRMAILFEGMEPATAAQAQAAANLLRDDMQPAVHAGADAARRWGELAGLPEDGCPVKLKVTHLPTELGAVLSHLGEAAARWHAPLCVRGQIGNGVLSVHLSGGDPMAAVPLVSDLRSFLREGGVTVVQAPAEVKRQLDPWGPVGDTLPLMRRVKEQFDPAGVLNPGRFVGGI